MPDGDADADAGTVLAAARRLADEVLFPNAEAVDAGPLVPRSQLDALADVGLYGMACPVQAGGLGLDRRDAARLVEILAGGCLTTTFVWLQHHGAVGAVASGPPASRERWLADLCAGRVRGGIALAGARPDRPSMRASRRDGGWAFDGTSSWVTGWGLIDLVLTAARTDDDHVVWALLDAAEGPSVQVEPLPLLAVGASGTVLLRLDRHVVSEERVTKVEPVAEWIARDATGLRTNGSLALGLAGRCATLLDSSAFRDSIDECREALDAASIATMPAARAAASTLAWRAAGAVVAAGGSRSVLLTGHAQRLAREAAFLLVFGQRPAIRSALLETLQAGSAGTLGPG